MTTLLVRANPAVETVAPARISQPADDQDSLSGRSGISGMRPAWGQSESSSARCSSTARGLDLSKSKTYDAALDILGTYKLSGNFHTNIEIVLKHLGASDNVTFEIEHKSARDYCGDCRHVVFRPTGAIHADRFNEIIDAIKARIGFDAAAPWWMGLIS